MRWLKNAFGSPQVELEPLPNLRKMTQEQIASL